MPVISILGGAREAMCVHGYYGQTRAIQELRSVSLLLSRGISFWGGRAILSNASVLRWRGPRRFSSSCPFAATPPAQWGKEGSAPQAGGAVNHIAFDVLPLGCGRAGQGRS